MPFPHLFDILILSETRLWDDKNLLQDVQLSGSILSYYKNRNEKEGEVSCKLKRGIYEERHDDFKLDKTIEYLKQSIQEWTT